MEDDGYGYPDVTGSDGIYTGTLPKFADKPGESDVLIIVLHLTYSNWSDVFSEVLQFYPFDAVTSIF